MNLKVHRERGEKKREDVSSLSAPEMGVLVVFVLVNNRTDRKLMWRRAVAHKK